MKEYQFTLRNLGMNRDLSVSKAGESSAYENVNIRITARDKDTLLSVTNERGNTRIPLNIEGTLVGWNVLNNHILLFTTESIYAQNPPRVIEVVDRIYRVDYTPGEANEFAIIRGNKITEEAALYTGTRSTGSLLGFNPEYPIESIVYAETDDIQKIYWVDGQHVLRFMNFMAELDEVVEGTTYLAPWEHLESGVIISDNTYFDSNRAAQFSASCEITKDNSGNTRANGVVQYLLTYFNEHGQETGYVWVSDLVYLSPLGRGGGADETNTNSVTLRFSNLDTSFTHFRVYSVFRSSLNGQVVAYLVTERHTSDDVVSVVDDGAHLTVQDTTRLLYLGSQPVIVSTMTHKDQTLFLGDLKSIGRNDYDTIEALIKDTEHGGINAMYDTSTGISSAVSYVYSNSNEDGGANSDIPYVENTGLYPYKNQLSLSSSQIQMFKGGEKYRFALKFQRPDGSETDAFWIGDKENSLYPVIDVTVAPPVIKRAVAKCIIPERLVSYLKQEGYATVRLCIAEATYADRSVKAQGIVNPTMFNTWERYNNRVYAMPSWISRPRGSQYACRHFQPTANASSSIAEIQCNYWTLAGEVPPYYQYKLNNNNRSYIEAYDGILGYDQIRLAYGIKCEKSPLSGSFGYRFTTQVIILTAKALITEEGGVSTKTDMLTYEFKWADLVEFDTTTSIADDSKPRPTYIRIPSDITHDPVTGDWATKFEYTARVVEVKGEFASTERAAAENLYENMKKVLRDEYSVSLDAITAFEINNSYSGFLDWCIVTIPLSAGGLLIGGSRYNEGWEYFYNGFDTGSSHSILGATSALPAMNAGHSASPYGWTEVSENDTSVGTGERAPAYRHKHIMYVDENVITLDSPELSYENLDFDNADLNFRIVGAVKMSSVISDYVIDATKSSITGSSYDKENFSGSLNSNDAGVRGSINGILSWPIWKEYGLVPNDNYDDATPIDKRTMSEYSMTTGTVVRYWMYMWQHSGIISGFNSAKTNDEDVQYNTSVLNTKTFANLRFAYDTIYLKGGSQCNLSLDSLRIVREFDHSYNNLAISSGASKENRYYESTVQLPLSLPNDVRYPLFYSDFRPEKTYALTAATQKYLYSNSPVVIEYRSGNHAVMSLPTSHTSSVYTQTILPSVFAGENISIPDSSHNTTGALLPWIDSEHYSGGTYTYTKYDISSASLPFTKTIGTTPGTTDDRADSLSESDQYLFIGEIYKNYSGNDTRYGGISEAAIQNNRFIAAGPAYQLDDMGTTGTVFGNQGDTYFQRWDCLRTKPYSEDAENKVIDITSFMVETHINLDGRSDLYRGMPELTAMNLAQFGQLNRVYSQQDNFSVRRDLDSDFNTDVYRSSITWTLPKSDMADIDEWTHITLASTLKLDSDKGICRALRRFNNGIVAFQDKAISEILFNSMTPLSTTDSVPVEIANSGKVDGKRYVSNKYGCVNKWSIAEGKGGLYFVDNINKAFCSFNYAANGKAAIDNLSEKLGFGVWFRDGNTLNPWTPKDWDNIISHYDKVHQDVYLVKKEAAAQPALVYNELLGRFTSFFNYGSMPMLTNVEDKLVSFHGSSMWLQNSGLYSNFFGQQYPFSVQYRVTPEPYGDKIWTNVEYRADFYRTLDEDGAMQYDESELTETSEAYQKNETFDYMRFWNEYQTTDDSKPIVPVKKFRIWRLQIPRAQKDEQFNPYGLDRIRNPWLNLKFQKNYVDVEDDPETEEVETDETRQDLMQLHDITVKYFE